MSKKSGFTKHAFRLEETEYLKIKKQLDRGAASPRAIADLTGWSIQLIKTVGKSSSFGNYHEMTQAKPKKMNIPTKSLGVVLKEPTQLDRIEKSLELLNNKLAVRTFGHWFGSKS